MSKPKEILMNRKCFRCEKSQCSEDMVQIPYKYIVQFFDVNNYILNLPQKNIIALFKYLFLKDHLK